MSTAGDELRSRVAPLLEVCAPRKNDRHKDIEAHRTACRDRIRRLRLNPAYRARERAYENRADIKVQRKIARILKEQVNAL